MATTTGADACRRAGVLHHRPAEHGRPPATGWPAASRRIPHRRATSHQRRPRSHRRSGPGPCPSGRRRAAEHPSRWHRHPPGRRMTIPSHRCPSDHPAAWCPCGRMHLRRRRSRGRYRGCRRIRRRRPRPRTGGRGGPPRHWPPGHRAARGATPSSPQRQAQADRPAGAVVGQLHAVAAAGGQQRLVPASAARFPAEIATYDLPGVALHIEHPP